MSRLRRLTSWYSVLFMALALVSMVSSTVDAAGTYGISYFEGINPGNFAFIPTNELGSDSLLGSVLPNYTGWGAGSGAIGDTIMNMKTPANVSRKEKFYNLLHWEYTSGNAWEKAGSAQIALSLLGYGFGSHTGNRTVTDGQWADLRARLVDNSDLDMVWRGGSDANRVSRRDNTGGVVANGRYDSIRVDNGDDVMVDAWQFRSISSGTSYALYEIACGNGIGNIAALPQPVNWSTSGSSQVGVNNGNPNVNRWPPASWPGTPLTPPDRPAQPTDTVYWRHKITNNGPDTTSSIAFAVNKSGFSNGWDGNIQPQGSFALNAGQFVEIGYKRDWSDYSVYTVTQADVGHTLCESVSWGPWSSSRPVAEWKASDGACVYVPYDFKLTPTVKAPTDTVEPGVSIGPIDPNVNNRGPTKSYDGTQWQLSKFIVSPGSGIPGTADANGNPCAYYKNSCATLGSGNQTFAPGESPVGSLASYTVDDAPAGSRICFALSTTGYDSSHQPNSGWWRNGVPTCVMVGKKPKLQVWGGDVATRAGINVSLTQKTTGMYGSWVEYGAFSVGSNKGFASGAGLNPTPTPQVNNSQSGWSTLTFANVNAAGGQQFGSYVAPASNFRSMPNIAQYFGAISNKAAFVGNKPGALENTFQTGSGVRVMTAGDLTLQADTIPKGRSTVIVASGTVTITGDITYDSKGLVSLADIPQLVIIAKNINITSGVNNVDAWLVTSDATAGAIDTCSEVVSTDLTAKVCNNKLTIHGPVVAGELHLKRTGGSDTGAQSGDPAELINLRPDAYLWGQLVAGGAGKAETVNTIELPPRF